MNVSQTLSVFSDARLTWDSIQNSLDEVQRLISGYLERVICSEDFETIDFHPQ
jgi:hypothetical protein